MIQKISLPTRLAIDELIKERLRQDQLKAEGRFKWTCADLEMSETDCAVVLMEEVGELCRAILEYQNLTFDRLADHVEGKVGKEKIMEEATQVAAVSLAIMERSFIEKKTLEDMGQQ